MKEKKYMRDDADGAGLVAGFKFAERTTSAGGATNYAAAYNFLARMRIIG